MFRSNSPYGYDNSSYAGSIQSNGYSMDELSSQASGFSRPSAKSIYMQRKEYAEGINSMMDKFQYRVEHLFTCELDGREVRDVKDSVERLKLLDGLGRVWGQDMMIEVRGGNLLLTDIETKEELESLSLSSIMELTAVMDSCVYNSLLTVSVQDHSTKTTRVFMFQCEDLRANYIEKDLKRALLRKREDPRRGNVEALATHQAIQNLQNREPKAWNPPEDPPAQWDAPDYDDDPPTPVPVLPREEPPPRREKLSPSPPPVEDEPALPPRPYTEVDRNVDILNHIFNDLEIFMGKVAAQEAKNGKKKKKKKKKGTAIDAIPPAEEFEACLQKIKCGFNLLGELNGEINNPSAPDFVHVLFSTLGFVVSHCPEDLPSTIVAPLLTPECIRLLSQEATTEEDQLWQSLGDPWNIPSTKWPEDDEDIPIYNLEFYDGWQPPAVTKASQVKDPVSRQQSGNYFDKTMPSWTPPPSRPDEPDPSYMRVLYDFTARNNRELCITKGEVVQLLDMSKQWWKVRNAAGEEGYVPNNILESVNKEHKEQTSGPPVLTKRSKPSEVKAWLEHKGFSKITVRCLGVLSGSMLLGMTREELKIVCPEQGGRVFFQLQALKSAIALSSEVRPMEP
ncbi:epidermal growth factor receptor kinase substrate 8-like protein 3 [Aplochiton taeniatus]